MARLADVLTTVRSVNKTDVITLATAFGSLKDVAAASREDLLQCPGPRPTQAAHTIDKNSPIHKPEIGYIHSHYRLHVNMTDVITLATAFGSLKDVAAASREDLLQCPGRLWAHNMPAAHMPPLSFAELCSSPLLSIVADDAHRMTWCYTQRKKLCISRGRAIRR
jgi:DNA integrity scanning protein DisA with diadenylate cyclase activity